jgi:hypothetical protein
VRKGATQEDAVCVGIHSRFSVTFVVVPATTQGARVMCAKEQDAVRVGIHSHFSVTTFLLAPAQHRAPDVRRDLFTSAPQARARCALRLASRHLYCAAATSQVPPSEVW